MPDNNEVQRHGFTPRTHVRVVRTSDNREWPNMFVAYRELLGTSHELGYSEHQRMRATIRSTGAAVDRHGFTWRSMGGAVSESEIAWTDFTFGVELELVAPFGQYDMRSELDRNGGSDFRVVHDGSLHAGPGLHAMEVVSPVLQGTEGLAKLRKVMDFLRGRGCRINNSCGMHVHIGVRGMKPERVRRIAIAFLNAEHHFDALVPPIRRNNRYAQSNFARVNGTSLHTATTISAMASVMNGGSSPQHYNPYRYYKLNFQSFVHHGTIEFRQHAGTVESDKACAWVRLIAGFCARAAGSTQQTLGERESFEQWIAACTDEAGQRYMQQRRTKFSGTARREAA